jgi:hypothetical protein
MKTLWYLRAYSNPRENPRGLVINCLRIATERLPSVTSLTKAVNWVLGTPVRLLNYVDGLLDVIEKYGQKKVEE